MKKTLFIAFAVAALAAGCSRGRSVETAHVFLEPLQERDSVLVMDQLSYGFELPAVPESVELGLPDFVTPGEPLTGTILSVTPWMVDTLRVIREAKDAPARYDLRIWFVLTPQDEGEYELPALSVSRKGVNAGTDTLFFDPQALSVKTMPVDTATYVPHDIKDQARYPLTAREIVTAAAVIFYGAAILIAIWCLIRLYRGRNRDEARPDEPAHITALRRLDRYRGKEFWVPEKQKAFYSGVTDALRGYMAGRYGIGAMEMTTAEIFDALKTTDAPKELCSEMQGLFERADFVKFAKYTASDAENATVLPQAVRFVTETYQTAVEEENSETPTQS